jgi:hypothetical protein
MIIRVFLALLTAFLLWMIVDTWKFKKECQEAGKMYLRGYCYDKDGNYEKQF